MLREGTSWNIHRSYLYENNKKQAICGKPWKQGRADVVRGGEMQKSLSVQKAVKKWCERGTPEKITREWRTEILPSLYFYRYLFAWFLAQKLCTLSFLQAFSCPHSAIKHTNILYIWWEGIPSFHFENLTIKQDPGSVESIFSLCCLLLADSEGTQGWNGGSWEDAGLWYPYLTTHPLSQGLDREIGVYVSVCVYSISPCSAW